MGLPIEDTMPLLDDGDADRLRQVTFPGAGSAENAGFGPS